MNRREFVQKTVGVGALATTPILLSTAISASNLPTNAFSFIDYASLLSSTLIKSLQEDTTVDVFYEDISEVVRICSPLFYEQLPLEDFENNNVVDQYSIYLSVDPCDFNDLRNTSDDFIKTFYGSCENVEKLSHNQCIRCINFYLNQLWYRASLTIAVYNHRISSKSVDKGLWCEIENRDKKIINLLAFMETHKQGK